MLGDRAPGTAAEVKHVGPAVWQDRQEPVQPRPLDQPPPARLDPCGGILMIEA
jgi:hypothetical protein